MRSTRTSLVPLLLCATLGAAAATAEDLEGELGIGENLEIFLFPKPSFFNRVFSAVGLASPPEPVSLTDAAQLGRDDVVVAQYDEDWSVFAKVRPSENEVVWYNIGKPTAKFWEIRLQNGVTIKRVKKSAAQMFEGSVEGDPWFLRVDAPSKIQLEEEATPKLVGIKFWLSEYIFNYDEISHGGTAGSSARKKRDNYSVLRDALVTALPDELEEFGSDPEPFERVKQLEDAVHGAHPDDRVPLRDLLEAKVARLDAVPAEDEGARKAARERYEALLEDLRRRTSDE